MEESSVLSKLKMGHSISPIENPLKIKELRRVNEEIKHYEDVIVKKKPGRKVQDLVQKFDTPKKK